MEKTFSQRMNELAAFLEGYTPLKVVKPTIEAGQPAKFVSFHGEHPEPYSDEALKKMKQNWREELLGLVGGSLIITLIFFGLISIL